MTEKRFIPIFDGTDKRVVGAKDNGKIISFMDMFDLLNDLSDENEQLRKENDMLSCELSVSANKEISKNCRIAELEEQLAAFQIERNKSELKSVLGSRGLSPEFADIINISDDIEASQANIDKLDKLFKAAVKAEVEKRLAGNAPNGNKGNTSGTEVTKEMFKKMGLSEQAALYRTNPELYKQLTSN